MAGKGPWDDARTDELTKLWAEGLSGSQIALRLGGITRNSVIGKIHRLGLSGRSTPTRRYVQGKVLKVKFRRKRANGGRLALLPLTRKQQSLIELFAGGTPLPAPQAEDIGRKVLLDLEDNDCRWPCKSFDVNSKEQQMFCASERLPGLSYCRQHAARAFDLTATEGKRRHGFSMRTSVNAPMDSTKALDEFADLETAG